MVAKKDVKKKSAAQPKKAAAYKYLANYDVSSGSLTRKNKSCPKCGVGVFLAKHKERYTCGKCGYMERVKKD